MSTIRDRIEKAESAMGETVDLPEWGMKVEVRPMTIKTRAEIYKMATLDDDVKIERLYPLILVACVHDVDTGEFLFTDDDSEWLAQRVAGPAERLAEKALTLSGLNPEALESGKAESSSTASTGTA